jgi:nuclear factor NF-kappa-B p105 subunit
MSPPSIELIEQPLQPFRFRYKSEMHGTHGSLMGVGTERTKKTFPTVALRNFNYPTAKAMIRCSLYQVPSETKLIRSPHSHRLISRHNDVESGDPHDREVSIDNDYTAV